MSTALVIAQAAAEEDNSASAAAAVFGVFALVGVLSIIGVASRNGRRLMLPLVAILLGASIIATSVSEARANSISVLTFIGLFFGILVAVGGYGALREGIVVPDVEGVEPDPTGKPGPGASSTEF